MNDIVSGFKLLKFKEMKSCISLMLFTFIIQFIPMNVSALTAEKAVEKLETIHAKLELVHGSLLEEYPEQLMAVRFINKNAKVLELGGNVGRNSCVIATLLNNSRNLVTVECCVEYAEQLKENRDANKLSFNIEVAAISKIPLIQSGWVTIPGDEELPGFTKVKTVTFNEVQRKYRLKFDTLVADCEGALYYILQDDPKILRNINTVVIENDFTNLDHMLFVQNLFKENGLELVYNQAGGWGPCYDCFYQVWQK